MHTSQAALVMALASVAAAKLGFNYGSTFTTGAAKAQSDFEAEFTAAANLANAKGFTSARLYTMVQADSTADPIAAIPAAIKTGTTLLLGLWASGGDAAFANEITALTAAIKQYGSDFTSIVDGISIGSEDLYRASPQGIAAGSDVGAGPDTIVDYIKQVKTAIAGTGLANAPLGHVDTWTAWENGSNSAVVDELDWIGMDAYPYFQSTMANGIELGKSLFDAALATTKAAAGGKEVWVTETGYPVSGAVSGDAVASVKNAQKYWQDVGCPMFDNTNVWWYTLQDAEPTTPSPSFGLVGSTLSSTPLFDLSCDDVTSSSSSSSSSASKTKTSSATKASGTSGATKTSTDASASATSTGSGSHSSGSASASASSSGSSFAYSTSAASSGASTGVYPTGSTVPTTTGSGSGSGTGAPTTSATPTSTSVPIGAATGLKSGGLGAAFVALMAAIFAL